MASSGKTWGIVIGIVIALGLVTLAFWFFGRYKESFKYKKGKLVYECDLTYPIPNDPWASTGKCNMKARTTDKPSTYVSMTDCNGKCGTFYTCQPGGTVGFRCLMTGQDNNGVYSKTNSGCDATCNKYNPGPQRGSVPSGKYLIRTTNNATYPQGAYLRTYYDCTATGSGASASNNQVYAFFDTTATAETADVWTFDLGAGTLKSNQVYSATTPSCASTGLVYPYAGQELYLSMIAPEDQKSAPQWSIMAPLTGSPYSNFTKGWYLSTDTISGGRIARDWGQELPYDFVCVDSYFPRSSTAQNPGQPAWYCRAIGDVGSLQFVEVR